MIAYKAFLQKLSVLQVKETGQSGLSLFRTPRLFVLDEQAVWDGIKNAEVRLSEEIEGI